MLQVLKASEALPAVSEALSVANETLSDTSEAQGGRGNRGPYHTFATVYVIGIFATILLVSVSSKSGMRLIVSSTYHYRFLSLFCFVFSHFFHNECSVIFHLFPTSHKSLVN